MWIWAAAFPMTISRIAFELCSVLLVLLLLLLLWEILRGFLRLFDCALVFIGGTIVVFISWRYSEPLEPSVTASVTSAPSSPSPTPVPDLIFLTAEVIDKQMDSSDYKTANFPREYVGKSGPDFHRVNAAFAADRRFPVASQQYLRVMVRNAGPRTIIRIWLTFPVNYVLDGNFPSVGRVSSLLSSPLNPIMVGGRPLGVSVDHPIANGLVFRDTPVMLAENDHYTFDFQNISNAFMSISLPTAASIVTPEGSEVAVVHSTVIGLGLPNSVLLAPNRPPTPRPKTSPRSRVRRLTAPSSTDCGKEPYTGLR